MPEERIQKLLARTGYGSRRASEELIAQGRVTLNGKVAILGNKADLSKDVVKVDGQPIRKPSERRIYIALNNPKRVLSDTDPNDPRPTVQDYVETSEHLFSVGRLDYDSEGLILLTNDGDLAHRLTHPRYGHEKEYRVQVVKKPDEEQLAIWRRGVVLADGYRTAPASVRIESSAKNGTWLNIVMKEGKKRQIREIGKTIGLPVQRIIRVRIGTLMLGSLKPGEWRSLKPEEIKTLKQSVKLE
jgi:23S rRNA pseudouridine2605 synthase